MSSNRQPSATTNEARQLLRRGGGGGVQNQRGHHRILTSYDAVHWTSVSINYSSSVMLKILIKVEIVYERFSIIHISNETKYLSDWYVNLIFIPIIMSCEFQVRGQITSLWITDKTLSWTELHWERSENYISGNLPQTTFFNAWFPLFSKRRYCLWGRMKVPQSTW